MTRLKRLNDRKCVKCGQAIPKRNLCSPCYNKSPAGKARYKRYEQTAKGRFVRARNYAKHYMETGSSAVAKYVVIPGDEEKTQQHLATRREAHRRTHRNYHERWGNIHSNPVHRHRWEMIREGLWKEEEHPL